MGIEYVVRASGDASAVLGAAEGERLLSELRSMDPGSGTENPSVSIDLVSGGVYICDHLSNREVASRVLGEAAKRLLGKAAQVTIEAL